MAKSDKIEKDRVTKKAFEYKAVGQSFKNKGKPTIGQHFIDAAEIIELQSELITELEAGG